jgi:hypothetical protein
MQHLQTKGLEQQRIAVRASCKAAAQRRLLLSIATALVALLLQATDKEATRQQLHTMQQRPDIQYHIQVTHPESDDRAAA